MSRTSIRKSFAAAAAVAALTFSLAACGSDTEADGGADKGSEGNPVKIGVVKRDDYWTTFEQAAEAEGIFVEVTDLADYQIPNRALADGEIDLNQFQHLLFLAQFNVEAGEELVPIAATAVYPLGVYSQKHDSIDSIESGEVAVPNDPTNLARALLVLQDAGLVELKDGGSAFSTELDVLPTSKVTVTPVDATQTVLALPDVEASVVNNDFLDEAGLKSDDAIFADDATSDAARPYINIWASRADEKDNDVYAQLVEIYKSDDVQQGVIDASGGTAAIADQDGATLEGYLQDIQSDFEASN